MVNVTRTQLKNEGKIKLARDIGNPKRDFVNSPEFMTMKMTGGLQQSLEDCNSLESNHVCFVGGTLVHTERGIIPIQEVQVGDKVLSKNENDKTINYQTVKNVIKTEQQRVIRVSFRYWINESLSIMKRLDRLDEIKEKYGEEPRADLLVTANHPFWVVGKGWVEAINLSAKDRVVDTLGNLYDVNQLGDKTQYATIYSTDKPNIGVYPSYTGANIRAIEINLTTGEELKSFELGEHPFLDKFASFIPNYEQELRETFGVPDGVPADFHGFRTQERKDPNEIVWKDEDYATTTVYNLEVENTHTYFVGKYGILVHNCGGDLTIYSDNLTIE
ncbi:hypothetical protein LVY74_01860 [Acinetobacter sp. ME22]|uniref:hypothetical protein n=1 Tax=Acinetobacter sp. ME22 TaxID=2904802 RepID=UPI001EDA466E|nr:hypothetical protein [Acinetobacter sp. ME22]MCG2572302.1 hypothetical protein [Acinetobacter sp. ME22]